LWCAVFAAPAPGSFRFVFLGDRTGEAQPGVYERVWNAIASEKPAFVVSVGDTIQGENDATAEAEWRAVEEILAPYRKLPLYLVPGNHDIWSPLSERLFTKYAGHPPHYSFDHGTAHFTILDNSRSEQFSVEELRFLEQDLAAHAAQPLKFVISHRPSWLVDAALGNPAFPFHKLVRKYRVQYVVAGHIHQMLHADLDGTSYVSLPSAGGHLRLSGRYEDGWFFGYTVVEAEGDEVRFEIKELGGRVTTLEDWGVAGLLKTTVVR
jgi:predicted phosphohydrolase